MKKKMKKKKKVYVFEVNFPLIAGVTKCMITLRCSSKRCVFGLHNTY